jgi:hypothetical protein
MVVAPVVVEPERIKLLAYISPSASTRNLMLPPTAAEIRLPSAMDEAGLIYIVPSAPLEVPEGQEGLKTWARVGTLVKVAWAVEVNRLLVMVRPLRVVVPETVRSPPRVVNPVPTVKVLVPVILVFPFSVIAPEPVEKVLAPVWEKFPTRVWLPVLV